MARVPDGEGIEPALSAQFTLLDGVVSAVMRALIPFIDATLRTIPDRDHRATAAVQPEFRN
ncbi:MAG: hypothetical protein JO108_03740 [Acidobacteriaceae bacterium]|nr:hypothetical protein [Acidobacteriaceae bacterium]